jgi:hypothetical protein
MAGVMIAGTLALTSCKTGEEKTPELPIDPTVEATRAYQALQILTTENFALALNVDQLDMQFYRRGNDYSLFAVTMHLMLIVDGNFYEFNHGQRRAFYRPATEDDILDMRIALSDLDQILDLRGATFDGTGSEAFMAVGEREYEEFTLANGRVTRAYFSPEGELIGLLRPVDDEMLQIEWHVSANVPSHAFGIPHGLTPAPWSEKPPPRPQ